MVILINRHIMLLKHIKELVQDWDFPDEDLKLVLLYLQRIKHLVIIELDDGTLVFFFLFVSYYIMILKQNNCYRE